VCRSARGSRPGGERTAQRAGRTCTCPDTPCRLSPGKQQQRRRSGAKECVQHTHTIRGLSEGEDVVNKDVAEQRDERVPARRTQAR
jgi:hypothetical protein